MRLISTKAHGVMDYLVGVLLIAAPWIFDFARGGAETWVPVILGIGTIVYSLMTNYEMGAAKMISMKTHLAFDFISGAFLAVSPWIFGFNEYVYLPHLIVGIVEMGTALMTDPIPQHTTNRPTVTGRTHRHAH